MNRDYKKFMADVRPEETFMERMDRVNRMFKGFTEDELRHEHLRLFILATHVNPESINIEDTARLFYLKGELVDRGYLDNEDEDVFELLKQV